MVSKKLKMRIVFSDRPKNETGRDAESKALLNRAVRKVVLLMASIEAHGIMTREQIENCVIRAFEATEYLYYGLSEHELMTIVDKEIANDKGRKRHSERV